MAVRNEACPKRIRAMYRGQCVLDSQNARYVWERPYCPVYFFPEEDVVATLTDTEMSTPADELGERRQLDVSIAGHTLEGAARRYAGSSDGVLDGLVAVEWSAMDSWFEEDEQVHVHARNPYTRVDVLDSSRHVEVEVDGVKVADSHHPKLLFETGLPTRHYLPKGDVRMDLLSPTDTVSRCPYKGEAEWWSVSAGGASHSDLAWSYRYPVPESIKVAGLVCFFDEKVDVTIDGVPQERPRSPFS